ncbi:class I SAM-dependent DNA methyltransferase [Methylobacterium oxalidis]|uniref:class I SAM-dependent DNA methyltransferase n=1 Tax=Methylobacterium oxalidis TaxID=944322 RepID=UPI003315E98D
MTRYRSSLPSDYFEERYSADPDPWGFATSTYEHDKYAATLAALRRTRYAAALEVGCSIGVLTRQVAERCDAVVAVDVSAIALEQARARCGDLGHVRLELAQVPEAWPEGSFDLILLSEVVYYLDARDVTRLVERVRASLAPGGDVVLVHWTGETHYPLTGDEAAERFIKGSGSFLHVGHQTRTPKYRLDVLVGRDAFEREG